MELTSTLTSAIFISLHLFIAATVDTALSGPALVLIPPALIVPNNTMIVLQCQLHPGLNSGPSTSVNWYKNEEIIQRNDPNFHQHSDRQNNVFEIEFNASLITANNTNFSCFIHDNDEDVQCSSNDSSLVILTDKEFYTAENPWLIPHQTHFQLLWSPAYLWRDYYIEYFIISIMDLSDGSVVNKRVSVSKNLIDRYIESYNHTINQTCSEMLFMIWAYNRYDGMLNGSFHIKGKYQSDPNEFTDYVPPLSTIVLFNANGTPHLMTEVKLPPVCNCEEVVIEFTIITDDNKSKKLMYAETFNHTGPGIVNHMIDGANLTVNQHYNLRLVINVNDTTFENFQNFDTFVTCGMAGKNEIRYWLLIIMFLISLILTYNML